MGVIFFYLLSFPMIPVILYPFPSYYPRTTTDYCIITFFRAFFISARGIGSLLFWICGRVVKIFSIPKTFFSFTRKQAFAHFLCTIIIDRAKRPMQSRLCYNKLRHSIYDRPNWFSSPTSSFKMKVFVTTVILLALSDVCLAKNSIRGKEQNDFSSILEEIENGAFIFDDSIYFDNVIMRN